MSNAFFLKLKTDLSSKVSDRKAQIEAMEESGINSQAWIVTTPDFGLAYDHRPASNGMIEVYPVSNLFNATTHSKNEAIQLAINYSKIRDGQPLLASRFVDALKGDLSEAEKTLKMVETALNSQQ